MHSENTYKRFERIFALHATYPGRVRHNVRQPLNLFNAKSQKEKQIYHATISLGLFDVWYCGLLFLVFNLL